MSCVFCAFRDGALPAVRVDESVRAFAVMDIHPLNDGHVLVVPKAHVESLFEIPEADLLAVTEFAQRVAVAIRSALHPPGLHLLQNNGRAACQSVPHFHLHLIPRWQNDGKGFDWELIPGDPARLRALAERIRAAL